MKTTTKTHHESRLRRFLAEAEPRMNALETELSLTPKDWAQQHERVAATLRQTRAAVEEARAELAGLG